jgi:large subunit ribosomal protein L31
MKKEIHPEFHDDAKVTCGCGNTFTIGSTTNEISVEVCSKCHPFFTGNEKIFDTGGRVERFKRRMKASK